MPYLRNKYCIKINIDNDKSMKKKDWSKLYKYENGDSKMVDGIKESFTYE